MLSRRVEKNTLVPGSDLTLLVMSIFSGKLILHAGRQMPHMFRQHVELITFVLYRISPLILLSMLSVGV